MNTLFFTTESYAIDKPTGAGKYNQQHLHQLAEHGYKCTMLCLLVEKISQRKKALHDLESRGYEIESEELPLLHIDRIKGNSYEVIAFTHKPFKSISVSEKIKFIFLRNSYFNSKSSNIRKSRRNFLGLILAAIKNMRGFTNQLKLIDKWLYYYRIEPYNQALINYYKKENKKLSPDFILMDGWVERMAIANDFFDVTELKKPKLLSVVSTSIMTNYGPMALFSDKQTIFKTQKVKRIYERMDGFLVPSNYLKNYLLTQSSLDLNCKVVYPLVENDEKYLSYKTSSSSKKYVTLINASNFKGLPIFIALAKKFPKVDFMAVTTWGSMDKKQLQELENLPNVKLQKPLMPVDPIYNMTKILLVPSLWDEAFGMVIVEAMLRAIPVLGSDVGGLSEAKLDTDFLLPVNPYKTINGKVPAQEIGPWVEALDKLLSSEEDYYRLSVESQTAARDFIRSNKGKLLIDGFLDKSKKTEPKINANKSPEFLNS
ncbi:glycosyltransferase [Aquimarina pacifica]|uniref:glycosyltransferase n=1 Tax=Aquimarina pacifica TaxID=1296415 RepID=UPI0004702E84|nr:glycosyltransferase [Aquimarina pacifica]